MTTTRDHLAYDALTPDSGIHEGIAALSNEEQEQAREQWKAELAKTEDEIQTLRQVLGAKVRTAQELKSRLGITVWKEFSDDLSSSFRSVKESNTVQRANEVIMEFHEAVASAPLYQKTAGAIGAVGEKAGGLFGGIGAKFGALKETNTFKSFEERVGSVSSFARSKMGGSESNSTQDFEEALRNNTEAPPATTVPQQTSDMANATAPTTS